MSNREKIQKEALEKSLDHKRCGLGISMGVGKTRIALQHLIKNYHPISKYLVVIPKNSVIDSWNTEMNKMNLEIDISQQIEFVNYRSINKCNPKNYNVVYLDECHNLLSSHEDFLSLYNGKILNDYKIIVHELELSKVPNLQKKNKSGGTWYTSELKDYEYLTSRCESAMTAKAQQMSAIMRMRGLMEYNTKENYLNGIIKNISSKCIIFANTQKQADRICKYSYHSGNPKSEENLELFSDGRIDKLSCVLQLSEGISIPNLRQGIIMHAYGNNRKTAQRIGRLLRLSPDQKATCHILCYKETQDEKWVSNALEGFDYNKIEYFNPLNV
jgi:superfamily II DNA or RNA helicase